MNLFGFNISLSRTPSAPVIRSAGANWLRAEDADTTGTVLSNAYQQVVWVYRAINALADQVSNIPFLFSRGERGRENLITSGPLLDFYETPHRHLNRFQYWELRIIWLMLRGECFRIPIFEEPLPLSDTVRTTSPSSPYSTSPPVRTLSSASPYELSQQPGRRLLSVVFVDPSHMQHIIQDHELVGWRYSGPGKFGPLESQVFLPEEVWFEKLSNPFDFWRGMPPLFVADMAARTDFAAAAFMRGIIENNADNGLIVRSDQLLGDEQREQIVASLRNRKRKAGTADRPLFLWGVNEIVQPQLSSSDLQFLENRKFSRAEICAAFGVPEEIITATDHAKYDVMQGARLNFIENRVLPLCARLEAAEAVTVRAIDPTALGWFDIESLPIMQDARRNRLTTAKLGFDMGVPLNELNRIYDLGFKPLPWGNTGYLSSKLVPITSLAAPKPGEGGSSQS